jgi:hypothetical protein
MIKHKFHAKATEYDGIKFSSKKEAHYYLKLKAAKESGELLFFLRQCPLHLTGNIRYVIDFIEFWNDGSVVFTEVKGYMTEIARLKIRQAEDIYNISINIV